MSCPYRSDPLTRNAVNNSIEIKMKKKTRLPYVPTLSEMRKKQKYEIGSFAPMCTNKNKGRLTIHILREKAQMQNDYIKLHRDSDVDLSQTRLHQ
jgi:hypothetical protein